MTTVAILGLGTMGAGMAATVARAGNAVRAFDISAEARARAEASLPMLSGILDKMSMPARGDAMQVGFPASLEEAVAGADLVIENVPEKLELKLEVFRKLSDLVPRETILASDTSGLPITRLQAAVEAPERVIGMHWSNPPHIIPMIEVIAGERTAPATSAWMVDFVKSLNLKPVVVHKDVPGFVENRILYAIMREAVDLVERGVIDPEGLDTCVSWGIGYKLSIIGPMALLDMAGLDIYQSVGSYLNQDLCNRPDVSAYVTERTARGDLGLKSGAGIFGYRPEQIEALRTKRAKRFIAVRRALEG